MSLVLPAVVLVPPGSTGTTTTPGTQIPEDCESFCLQFVCEAAGATPTITWKAQVCQEAFSVADGSANWIDLWYVTHASDSAANTGLVVTSVGASHIFPAKNSTYGRWWRRLRVVTSANTNVTYRVEFYPIRPAA